MTGRVWVVVAAACSQGSVAVGELRAAELSGPVWTSSPTRQTSAFGSAVALGDFNGDGRADLAVGAADYSHEFDREGRAYLFYGAARGLPTEPDWWADPAGVQHAHAGTSIAAIGDVNRDGFEDLAVGATRDTYVFLGSASGPASIPDWTAAVEPNPDCTPGATVAAAGDVNGDGFADVLLGAPACAAEAETEGKAFVYLGSATGLGSTADWTADPTDHFAAQFGAALAAGDVDRDGFSDIVVGAPGWDFNGLNAGEGRAYLYRGGPPGLASEPAWHADPVNARAASFGSAIASADVNGDGFADVVVGAAGAERAYAFLGGAAGLATVAAWTFSFDIERSGFARTVASAGDVDGDRRDDIAVGAIQWSSIDHAQEGAVFLFPGDAAGLADAPAWSADPSDTDYGGFGTAIAGGRDLDGDGVSDLAVGAPNLAVMRPGGTRNEGGVYVFAGMAVARDGGVAPDSASAMAADGRAPSPDMSAHADAGAPPDGRPGDAGSDVTHAAGCGCNLGASPWR